MKVVMRDISRWSKLGRLLLPGNTHTHAEAIPLVRVVVPEALCIFVACAVTEIFWCHAFCNAMWPYDHGSNITFLMLWYFRRV